MHDNRYLRRFRSIWQWLIIGPTELLRLNWTDGNKVALIVMQARSLSNTLYPTTAFTVLHIQRGYLLVWVQFEHLETEIIDQAAWQCSSQQNQRILKHKGRRRELPGTRLQRQPNHYLCHQLKLYKWNQAPKDRRYNWCEEDVEGHRGVCFDDQGGPQIL